MTSKTAGQAFQVGILPPMFGISQYLPVDGSFAYRSACRYQSGIVLAIGTGREELCSFNQGLFETNLIFFVFMGCCL
jgi:N-acetylglucosamine kinase-like BadF-type ATPase